MTATGFRNQVQNKNFLSPTGFKFVLNRAPKVVFFSNQANIPGLNLGTTEQNTYLTDIPVPGDKIQFQDLNLRFLVDEDLENFTEMYNWIDSIVPISNTKNFETNKKGIFAAGDICSYPGKLKLILSGFHEVALASVECFKRARPNEKYRFEFTTASKTIQERLGKK